MLVCGLFSVFVSGYFFSKLFQPDLPKVYHLDLLGRLFAGQVPLLFIPSTRWINFAGCCCLS